MQLCRLTCRASILALFDKPDSSRCRRPVWRRTDHGTRPSAGCGSETGRFTIDIQAIRENGVFRPIQPISIKHSSLTTPVPDEELASNALAATAAASVTKTYSLPPEAAALAKAMERRMDVIRNAPLSDDVNLPPLTKMQLDRIEAFALREQVRRDR